MEKVSLSTPLGRITVIDALRGFALLACTHDAALWHLFFLEQRDERTIIPRF